MPPTSRFDHSKILSWSSSGTPRISHSTAIGSGAATSFMKSHSPRSAAAVTTSRATSRMRAFEPLERALGEERQRHLAVGVVERRVHGDHAADQRVDHLGVHDGVVGDVDALRRREGLRVARHRDHVLVARDVPEPGAPACGLLVPVHRVVAAQDGERVVADAVDEDVGVAEVDDLGVVAPGTGLGAGWWSVTVRHEREC